MTDPEYWQQRRAREEQAHHDAELAAEARADREQSQWVTVDAEVLVERIRLLVDLSIDCFCGGLEDARGADRNRVRAEILTMLGYPQEQPK